MMETNNETIKEQNCKVPLQDEKVVENTNTLVLIRSVLCDLPVFKLFLFTKQNY